MVQEKIDKLVKTIGHVSGICFICMLSLTIWILYALITKRTDLIALLLLVVSGCITAYFGAVAIKLVNCDKYYNSRLIPALAYKIMGYFFLTLGLIIFYLTFFKNSLVSKDDLHAIYNILGLFGIFCLGYLCFQASKLE